MSRFRTPLVILALGVIPFWFFIGSTSSTTINGEVVSASRLNFAGVIMGLIGAVMAFKALRDGDRGDMLRLGLIALAGVLCLVQMAHSVGIITVPI
jgi:hypothetical protein